MLYVILTISIAFGLGIGSLFCNWSEGGLFISFGLFNRPNDFSLLLDPIWGILWPVIGYSAISSVAGTALAGVCVVVACFGVKYSILWHLSSTILFLSLMSGLVSLGSFVLLITIPPGLWGGRFGIGGMLFVSHLIIIVVSGVFLSRASERRTLEGRQDTQPLPLAVGANPPIRALQVPGDHDRCPQARVYSV